jgi:hypothetical protein
MGVLGITVKLVFVLGLSWAFHCIVWEDDYVTSTWWKVYWAIMIVCLTFIILLN